MPSRRAAGAAWLSDCRPVRHTPIMPAVPARCHSGPALPEQAARVWAWPGTWRCARGACVLDTMNPPVAAAACPALLPLLYGRILYLNMSIVRCIDGKVLCLVGRRCPRWRGLHRGAAPFDVRTG